MQPGGATRARSWEMNQLMGETSPLLLLHQKQLDDALCSGQQSAYAAGQLWPLGDERGRRRRWGRQTQFRSAGSKVDDGSAGTGEMAWRDSV